MIFKNLKNELKNFEFYIDFYYENIKNYVLRNIFDNFPKQKINFIFSKTENWWNFAIEP